MSILNNIPVSKYKVCQILIYHNLIANNSKSNNFEQNQSYQNNNNLLAKQEIREVFLQFVYLLSNM